MKIPLLPQLLPARAAALALTLLIAPGLHAVTYYWDTNDSTSGFGTAGGTWAAPTTNNSSQGWSTSATGVNVMSGARRSFFGKHEAEKFLDEPALVRRGHRQPRQLQEQLARCAR